MSTSTDSQQVAYERYDRTTSRWGRITMLLGLLLSWAAPAYLVFFTDLQPSQAELWTGFLAVAAVFAAVWVIEPITYFPVLGPAAMYQAFMIGNIANKLLPSAIVAQVAIDAKPGTRRAELAAVTAICGAVVVHVVSLLVLVGALGTWLVGVLPESVVEVARLYIFPAIIGAVVVQLAAFVQQPRVTVIAVVVAALTQLVLVPTVPAVANFATALVVLVTMVLAWFLRNRSTQHPAPGRPETKDSP
ncbi:hypothetical protein ACU61A_24040 [Pseudonocardia sichuanensis]|uniref:Uncharacterized protein n=1 Tax=Pseudonocardia kunmingensis TaxID=630975 RepID=A0A543DWD3_9PSEU|nr:hypothetical protein [Pseudonocardia kunmingensis]TQM13650.1 hypothetical protein FB558_0403 [Pseudonocardia kunmingensis]